MPTAAIEAPKVRANGTVHVKLSARVAYDPGALKKGIGELMERLGCPKCFSGANCFFTHERDFIFEATSKATPALGPQPEPWTPSAATVSLGRAARFDIDRVFRAVDKVIDIIGACPCHSGFDILYLNESKVIGFNEQGEAQQFGA